MIDSWPFRVMFAPFNASTPHFRNTGSASQSHGEREGEKEYLIVLDAYCPGRQSLCYHLALRSDDCNRLVHRATWN